MLKYNISFERGVKLINLQKETKDKLEFEIFELNVHFEPQKFLEHFQRIRELCEKGYIQEIERILLKALTEGAAIANGYLYLLYFNFGPREKSRQYFDQVKKTFPDEEFWSDLANSSIWDNFDDSRNANC